MDSVTDMRWGKVSIGFDRLPCSRTWEFSRSLFDESVGPIKYLASIGAKDLGDLSSIRSPDPVVEQKVEAVGSEGVTVPASGIGIRKSYAMLFLLLELFDDNLFLLRLNPNKLEAFSPVDLVIVDFSVDEEEQRVDVDPRFDIGVSRPASAASCSFSLRAFLWPIFSTP
jgi:hypothetical protein